MAISGIGAKTFFEGLSDGNLFYIQQSDGTVLTCSFKELKPSNAGLGFSVYGVSIFPHSVDYMVTYLNLDSIGSSNSLIVDISADKNSLSFS